MHEVFLQRLAGHVVLRNDMNFRVFLEYEKEVMLNTKYHGTDKSENMFERGLKRKPGLM